MLKRDALGFPTYWPAQAVGWGYFYLLLLASNLPSLKKPGVLWVTSISVLSMFAASCAIHEQTGIVTVTASPPSGRLQSTRLPP